MNKGVQGKSTSAPEVSPSISVVMCAYTEARWADMLVGIQSLKSQLIRPTEVILVIDHNPVLLERAQGHLRDGFVRVIENQRQRGLSGARNTGLEIARGDIIAFMDEDASAAPDWLAKLSAIYEDPAVMGVGGAIHPVWFEGFRPKWFPDEFDWVVGCTYRGMATAVSPVRNLIGCNMSFRRYVCELNGDFRDGIGRVGTLPMGCEETEYCIRAGQRWPDKILIFDPGARVFHKVPTSRTTWSYFCSRCYAEGVSKALIGQFVGTQDGLSSEKSYVMKTLPQGMLRGVASTIFKFDPSGLARAGAIIVGLGLTTIGYGMTRFKMRKPYQRAALMTDSARSADFR
jgi:glucosyl-dolichyl phosphate glucuronosyltransferase